MTVHILGCGPAGLAAAQAATALGQDVRIFSKPRKSHMFGAQYLHKPIPGLDSGEPASVDYILTGTLEQYRRKVYGPDYDGTISPQSLLGNHLAWDIRHAYDQLWDTFKGNIEDVNLGRNWMNENRHLRPMVNSIPLEHICMRPLETIFAHTTIWAAGEAPEWGVYLHDLVTLDEDTVVCNGMAVPSWYRASRIFDRISLEWPGRSIPKYQSAVRVIKPISNTCRCWTDVLRVGRYGKYEKGVLVHHAYEETAEWLSGQL